MARLIPTPRKQRTRQHVIADLSLNHVERFILEAGHTAQRLTQDYGYDMLLFTYDEQGYVEPGVALIQFKAAEKLTQVGADYVFDLDIRDYNLWRVEATPIFLILFDATRQRAYWLHVQPSFRMDGSPQPKKGAKTVRVRVPKRQVINRTGIAKLRELMRTVDMRVLTEAES